MNTASSPRGHLRDTEKGHRGQREGKERDPGDTRPHPRTVQHKKEGAAVTPLGRSAGTLGPSFQSVLEMRDGRWSPGGSVHPQPTSLETTEMILKINYRHLNGQKEGC